MKVYAGMDPRLPLRDVPAHARRVESLGYDGLHVAETIHDSLSVSLLALEHTTRLTVRTSVTLAFVRSPTLIAYAAWDLSSFSGGRFELGLGTQIRQNIEGRFGMPWSDPVAHLRDHLLALAALFEAFRTGSTVDHDGTHHRLDRLQPYFNPGPDDATEPPAVWIGGVNAGMCQLAGELAAGIVTHPTNSSPPYLETICRPNLQVGAERAGRRPDEVGIVVGAQVVTGAGPAELAAERERQRRLFAFLYSTPAYRRTLELYGWDDLAGRLQAMIRDDRWDDLHTVVTDEVLDTVVPSAGFAELPGLLRERFAHLAGGLVLSPPADPGHDAAFAAVVDALRE